ncbi:CubicO group peptidase (beta-lactamase class C family) [Pseudoduganella flava]|uniref:CubicO group peptidase (Beta-lactamase class C family) n=1 Tax=Pseudoduganella flava TaxID=871742 RepID=A0A562Q3I8_9BURK|nr:serine hydrolase domain-containing protein [Pseudoduganella flava]QGZ41324.1 serine hydrolase [Pseudoduganella flava]TWI51268.1 CubicO group peptidase (beta-lactamase class C family) [Pseudoduganella flava]
MARPLRPAAWLRAAATACCAAVLLPALAQAPAPASVPSAVALTAADAESWLDGMMPTALRIAGVPGAVVVLVKDGKPLLQKGYGYADWEKAVPVDPATTLFRPGSISKLFTWTAVMQQVEQGKLDLDTDVNRYLDFAVPSWRGKALTLRHVMTHTTGLEETGRGLIVYDQYTPDNGKVLKAYIPPYLYEPGTTQGYSNWATALAGYIVQRVSGEPFDDYVEKHIFAPLGMRHSTFRQPLPPALRAHMAQGYPSVDEPAKPYEIVNLPPAGSLAAPGADMARFMLAYLGQGSLDGQRILKPETVQLMHTRITRGMPDLNGIGLGFYQQDVNGHRAVGHGGDTNLFHSELYLLPDDGIGLFVSVNAAGRHDQGKWLRERLYQGFVDRYLPDRRPRAAGVDEATATAHAHLLAGAYRNTRREDSSFMSVLQLLSPVKVEAVEHGRVAIEIGGSRNVFREVRPFLWEEEHGKRRLQAVVKDGKVQRWGLEPYVFAFVFEPVPFMASTPVLVALLAAFGVAVLTALAWPVAARIRRRHGLPRPGRPATLVRVASCLVPVAVALWVATVAATDGADPAGLLMVTQGVTIVAFVGGLLAALWHARTVFAGAKAGNSGGGTGRGMALLWVLAFAVLVGVGAWHHLLSFNPHY